MYYVINKYQSVLHKPRGTRVCYYVKKHDQSVLYRQEVPQFTMLSTSTRMYCTAMRYRSVMCCQEVLDCIVQQRGTIMSYAVKKFNESVLYKQEGPVRIGLSNIIREFYFQEVPEITLQPRSTGTYYTTKRCRSVLYFPSANPASLVDGN